MESEMAELGLIPENTVEQGGLVGGKLVRDIPKEQLRPMDTITLDGYGKKTIAVGTTQGVRGIDVVLPDISGVQSSDRPLLILKGVELRVAKTGLGKLIPTTKGNLVEVGVRAIDPNWKKIKENKATPVVWANGALIDGKNGVRLDDNSILAFGSDPTKTVRFRCEGMALKI